MAKSRTKKARRHTSPKTQAESVPSAPVQTVSEQVISKLSHTENSKRPATLQIIGTVMMALGILFILYPFVTNMLDDDNSPSIDEGAVFDNDSESDADGDTLGSNKVDASTLNALQKSEFNIQKINETGKWYATDYHPGDIGVGEYEVRLGDTLWEIAEAVYGSGFEWHKILERNKNQIGFLPDGSQALIIPGQILVIAK